MVQNGYKLAVSTEKLPEFLKKVRDDIKEIVREGVLALVAKSVERLYDMKFIEGRKYETSIFDQAVGMVSGKISGIALGAFHDDRFDFRVSLIIAKSAEDNKSQYVLLNTENFLIQHYWDELPEVQPFKFDATIPEDDPDYNENAEHGRIWHSIFEGAGWNIHLTGYAAQLSVQPKVEDMNISPDELKEFFSDPEIRSGEYIKSSVIIDRQYPDRTNKPVYPSRILFAKYCICRYAKRPCGASKAIQPNQNRIWSCYDRRDHAIRIDKQPAASTSETAGCFRLHIRQLRPRLQAIASSIARTVVLSVTSPIFSFNVAMLIVASCSQSTTDSFFSPVSGPMVTCVGIFRLLRLVIGATIVVGDISFPMSF